MRQPFYTETQRYEIVLFVSRFEITILNQHQPLNTQRGMIDKRTLTLIPPSLLKTIWTIE